MLDAGLCAVVIFFSAHCLFLCFFVFAVRLCDLVNYVTAFNASFIGILSPAPTPFSVHAAHDEARLQLVKV